MDWGEVKWRVAGFSALVLLALRPAPLFQPPVANTAPRRPTFARVGPQGTECEQDATDANVRQRGANVAARGKGRPESTENLDVLCGFPFGS